MKIKTIAVAAVLLVVAATGYKLYAHCQIPCGIYDDPARLKLLEEHVFTIERSMKEIVRIAGTEKPDWNQTVRWVKNKEHHADELTQIVTYYFMAQRVKPADPASKEAHAKYIHQLTLLHRIMIHAMKAKQTTDLHHVVQLRELIGKFKASYKK